MNYEEKEVSRERKYSGNIINVDLVKVELPDGRESSRDVVLHQGASVVIPIGENRELYLVKQFRFPIKSECLELPAGKIDKGEDPLTCAKRELKEETGLDAEQIKHILSIHTTPGFTDEILHIYAATGLKEGTSCADDDEFISCEKYQIDELIKMILDNKITDAKTVIGVFLADKILKKEIQL